MTRYVNFYGHRVVDIRSLDGVPENVLEGGAPIHPAYLNQLPDGKVTRARPEDDPAQTDRIAKVLHEPVHD